MTGTWRRLENNLSAAVEILKSGGILIFPTETSYGLGCDATNVDAVAKIFAIKGRSLGKALPVLVKNLDSAKSLVKFSSKAESIARSHWPGALNLVLPRLESSLLAKNCSSADGFQSVRVSENPIVAQLVGLFDGPLVATSANLSGQGALYDLSVLEESFGDSLKLIDGVIDVGPLHKLPASTTIRVVGNDAQILRQGNIVI